MQNARLIAARTQLKASLAKVAKALKLDQVALEAFEAGSKTPTEGGDWTKEARKVAAFYGYPPSRFWPDEARRIRSRPPAGEPSMSPEAVVDAKKIYGFVQKAVRSLNDLDLDMLQAHYCRDSTFEEIGRKRGLSGNRAREMFYKVIGKVRASVTHSYERVQKTVHQDVNYHRWDEHPMTALPVDLIIEAICETAGPAAISEMDTLVQAAEQFARTSADARKFESKVANQGGVKAIYTRTVEYQKRFQDERRLFGQKKLRNDSALQNLMKAVREYVGAGGRMASLPPWVAEPYDALAFCAQRIALLKKKARLDPVISERKEAKDALNEAVARLAQAAVLTERAADPSPLTTAAATVLAAGMQSLFMSRPKQSEQWLLETKKVARYIAWKDVRGAPPRMEYSISFAEVPSAPWLILNGSRAGWEVVSPGEEEYVHKRRNVSLAQAIQIAATAYTPHHAAEAKPSTLAIAKKMILV